MGSYKNKLTWTQGYPNNTFHLAHLHNHIFSCIRLHRAGFLLACQEMAKSWIHP